MLTESAIIEMAAEHVPSPGEQIGSSTADVIAFARAVEAAVRAEIAKTLELSADQIRLMAGELTAGEMRAVKAVLGSRAASIRTAKEPKP